MSRFDQRKTGAFTDVLKTLPAMKHQPHVAANDLHEVSLVLQAMPQLTFPINSAGELLDALGKGKTFKIVGLDVDPARMIKYMPAYYFPIASQENLVEKMAELIRDNRRHVDKQEHVETIRRKLPSLQFPIESPEQLARYVQGIERFSLGDRWVSPKDALGLLPRSFFPVRDQADFEKKTLHFVNSRALIEPE
jgi:hypothetical protein